jgi:hypothetical protein
MPLTTSIDVEQRLVVNEAWGTVTDDDFVKARRGLLTDPGFDASFDRLWDFSRATGEELSENTVRWMVATSPSHDQVRRAIVCTAPATVARVMEFIARSRDLHRQIAVFPTREQALLWIQSEPRDLP